MIFRKMPSTWEDQERVSDNLTSRLVKQDTEENSKGAGEHRSVYLAERKQRT